MTQEFEFSEDLLELRQMVRMFCQEVSDEEVVRATMASDAGYDPVLWKRLGSELGVLGLSVPEALGGDDAGLVATAIVFEELGASLVCGPVVGTLALAIPALSVLPDTDVARDLLAGAMAGESVLTLIAPLTDGTFNAEDVTIVATATDDGWTLDGSANHVADGLAADTLLVVAQTPAGAALFAIDGAAQGVQRSALTTMDLTRRQALVELSGVAARQIADSTATAQVCEHAAQVAAVLIAAEQVGGAQVLLDTTVEHARTRLQFGQAIGAFQAVKHKCADMLMALEQTRSVAYHGAWALQDGTDDARLAASLARAVASESYYRIAATSMQLHGGLGFTWELNVHLYFKRAVADQIVLGSTEQAIERVAQFAVDA